MNVPSGGYAGNGVVRLLVAASFSSNTDIIPSPLSFLPLLVPNLELDPDGPRRSDFCDL